MASEAAKTVGQLRADGVITNNEIAAAVEAYLINWKMPPFRFESGPVLDVAAAVYAHREARAVMTEREATEVYRRTIVRTAVTLATSTDK